MAYHITFPTHFLPVTCNCLYVRNIFVVGYIHREGVTNWFKTFPNVLQQFHFNLYSHGGHGKGRMCLKSCIQIKQMDKMYMESWERKAKKIANLGSTEKREMLQQQKIK